MGNILKTAVALTYKWLLSFLSQKFIGIMIGDI
jgi:hypothetical protein